MSPQPLPKRAVTPRLPFLQIPALQTVALIILLTAAAVYEAFHITAFQNADLWLHLKTGLWMLDNHSIPRAGLFSQYASSPWIDTSWLYDAAIASGYRTLGLKFVPVLLMLLKLVLAALTFLLARGLREHFWLAFILSAAAQLAIPDLQPAPGTLSILFFAIELAILLSARAQRSHKILFWLPAIFLLWANLHVQFICGLLLLYLFLLVSLAEHQFKVHSLEGTPLPILWVGIAIFVSTFATFLTPYGIHLLPEAAKISYAGVLFRHLPDMAPLGFRRPQDFILMLLAMAAFLVLGYRRSRDIFQYSLLIAALLLSLRVQRDSWIVVLVAVAILARSISPQQSREEISLVFRQLILPATLALIVFLWAASHLPANQVLARQSDTIFPVRACEFLHSNPLPQPLFHEYNWGGFLAWQLPEYPVAIDSRLGLYGEDRTERYFKVYVGSERLDSDTDFGDSRTLLLDRRSGMARAFTTLPSIQAQYRLVYQDDLSIILVAY